MTDAPDPAENDSMVWLRDMEEGKARALLGASLSERCGAIADELERSRVEISKLRVMHHDCQLDIENKTAELAESRAERDTAVAQCEMIREITAWFDVMRNKYPDLLPNEWPNDWLSRAQALLAAIKKQGNK